MNIYAYTGMTHTRPPYVSINEVNGEVTLAARSEPRAGQLDGDYASLVLPPEEVQRLSERLLEWLAKRSA